MKMNSQLITTLLFVSYPLILALYYSIKK